MSVGTLETRPDSWYLFAMRHVILALILAMFSAACTEEVSQSGGAFFEDMGIAMCDRAAECGFISYSEVPLCVDSFVNAACAVDVRVCQSNYSVPADEWERCLEEFETHACAAIDAGILPSECLTIDELL